MTYLVDTDYLADFLKGYKSATSVLENLLSEGLGISIITFAEVYEGIYYGQNRAVYERGWQLFLRTTPVLSITRSIAKQYARMRGDLARKGQLIDQPDRLIAATAIHEGVS